MINMKDERKTKEQLIKNITELRKRIAELEGYNVVRKQAGGQIAGIKSRLRYLLIAAPAVIYACEPFGDYTATFISENIKEQLGYMPQEFLDDPNFWADHIHPEDATRILADNPLVLENGYQIREYRFLHKDGKYRWILEERRLVSDADGIPLELVGYWIDITKRKHMEESLQKSEARYRSLVDSTDDSIYLVDRDYRYLFMNRKHRERMGLSNEEYIGKPYTDMHSPEETERFIDTVNKVFNTGESVQDEYRSKRDGKYFLQTISPVKEMNGKTLTVSVVSKNITERKQMEEELRSLSLTDELTGLYNRRGFFTLAEHEIRMARRLMTKIFMLYVDMDNLKGINDTFGHREGDLALIDTAHILKENYRDSDIIARIGGDEFVVIPAGNTDEGADIIMTRLQRALENHNEKVNRFHKLSVSAGIACYDPESPFSLNELLNQADKLMYEQKRRKKTS
jgi:diguanylate cyclase (GGDEF)-like protein/PAS domain S-box-containing protein